MTPFETAVQQVRDGADPRETAAGLLQALGEDEKLGLLDGDEPFWPGMPRMMGEGYNLEPIVAGEVQRLGIPGIRFSDGPRGAVIGHSTAFPVPMARGATWDPELEERVGSVIGAEIRAQGGNYFGGVCINLLRHPAWGRAQETYGEDPVLLGAMGAALTRGSQQHVMACVKHYACNSMENARFTVDVRVEEQTLHEVYLPHFRQVVGAGVASVMSAYNSVNGEWCGQNEVLLRDILKDEWGFEGFVVSDFIWGLRDPVRSLAAGLDVEMPFAQQRAGALAPALQDGRASWADVDAAVMRILTTQLRFAAAVPAEAPTSDDVVADAHRALAREVAARSMVLLRNEPVDGAPVLPLDASALRRVAVVGRLADVANLGDHGSSDVRPTDVVTPLAGLRAALPDVDVVHVGDDGTQAAAAARDADVAVVVVGYTADDEGEYVGSFDPDLAQLYPASQDPSALEDLARVWEEGPQAVGGDRTSLRLSPEHEALVQAVAAANPRTVVAVMTGSSVVMEEWRRDVPGLLLLWYPGMEGGRALADVLLGEAEPGGRLPFVVPVDEGDLPEFDKDATEVVYDRWYGQRLLDRDGTAPAYPLGFGLSYTSFAVENLEAAQRDQALLVSVDLLNTGDRDGRHVVQVYAVQGGPGNGCERTLLGFASVPVPAGKREQVTLSASLAPLCSRVGPGQWRLREGGYRIEVGSFAGDPAAVSATVQLS